MSFMWRSSPLLSTRRMARPSLLPMTSVYSILTTQICLVEMESRRMIVLIATVINLIVVVLSLRHLERTSETQVSCGCDGPVIFLVLIFGLA